MKTFRFFIFLVILLAFSVRFIRLDTVPASLYYDEVDFGYQTRSLLTTGKDYRNVLSPFYFRSFNTDRTPFPIYFSILPSLLFSSPEYQVRAGAALAGVICVILGMLLAYQLTGKKFVGILTGLVFAFSPWQIQFSRIAFEAIFMLMVFMASIAAFLYWQKTKKPWIFFLSAVLLGLNVYTYRTMSLFAPLTILLLIAIYFKDIWKEGLVKVGLWLFIMVVMILPFMYATTIGAPDQTRINQISVFSDPMVPVNVMRNREIDSNDFGNPEIGKSPVWWSKVFHNKVVSYLTAFGYNYYRNFSADFLFLTGDPNIRHSPRDTGVLLFVDIVGILAGLVLVINNLRIKKYQLLLALLFLSPIPSDLTMDGAYHASRLMIMAAPLLLIVGLGYSSIIKRLWSNMKYRWVLPVIFLLWITAVGFYLQNYFIHYPIDSAKQFGYGYKQAIEGIQKVGEKYQTIRLSAVNDPPMLYYLYWSKTAPREVQIYGSNLDEKTFKGLPLDKIKSITWMEKLCTAEEILKLDPKTIYMVSYYSLPLDFRSADKDKVPTGLKLIDVIKYPDNEVAFYLITRDSRNGIPIMPDKLTSCK